MLTRNMSSMTGGLALAWLIGACSPGPMPVSQSAHDPSNPAAAEGAPAPAPAVAAEAPPSTDPHAGHGGHVHQAPKK